MDCPSGQNPRQNRHWSFRTALLGVSATLTLLSGALIGGGLPAQAVKPTGNTSTVDAASPVVVELFTSQGCSSCPPADAFLVELAQRPDVVALAFHVNYWDRLGWPDRFASAWATDRQYGYSAAMGKRNVYTPQMVIAGTRDAVGSNRLAVDVAIASIRETMVAAPTLGLEAEGDSLRIQVSASPVTKMNDTTQSAPHLLLARYLPRQQTPIGRGENSGRTLTEANIVTELIDLGGWNGAAVTQTTTRPEGYGHALFLQEVRGGQPGRILAAAKLDP